MPKQLVYYYSGRVAKYKTSDHISTPSAYLGIDFILGLFYQREWFDNFRGSEHW